MHFTLALSRAESTPEVLIRKTGAYAAATLPLFSLKALNMRQAIRLGVANGLVIAALCIGLFGCSKPTRPDVETVTTDGGRPPTTAAPSLPTAPNPMSLGSATATLTIVEFSDYQCSFCRRFHDEVLPALRKSYIDTGKVQLLFKDFPLSVHREALPAAIAGRCAGAQGKFWPMNELLFTNQERLSGALYPKLAESLALDVEAFKRCQLDPALTASIQRDQQQALDLGVNATPGFLIGRRLPEGLRIERVGTGFIDFKALSMELDKMLAAPVPE